MTEDVITEAQILRNLEDESLVDRARAGDEQALEDLLNKYRHYARAKARTYFLAGADKEDIVQEGMIGLFKAIRDFDLEFDPDNLETLDGRELAELFKRLEQTRRRTEGALAAVVDRVADETRAEEHDLPLLERIEHPIVAAHIKARMFEAEEVRTWERNPQLYGDILASSLADYITGQVIAVDGGFVAR